MTGYSAISSSLPSATECKAAPFSVGSSEHKHAFCSVLLDLFDPYKPSIIAWPKLSGDAQKRLTGLPFWDVAVETEGYASARMQAMADIVRDPLIKEALALNAFEEGRHKLVIHNMLRFYGIALKPERPYGIPANPETMFIRTGYGECFDSFFAFGLFRMARESGYFPPELVEVFEPVVQEEARHIMFFVNWVAWTAANKAVLPRMWFRARCFGALIVAGFGRLWLAGMAEDGGKSSENFVASGGEALTTGLTLRRLLEIALVEDTRRMQRFDPRLLRPRIMPFLARMALRVLP
jgi:hypothetical protein